MAIYEVVKEFFADSFPNSGRLARGRILRAIPDDGYSIKVNETVRGIDPPNAEYPSVQEAEDALFDFWNQCRAALEGSYPDWKDI